MIQDYLSENQLYHHAFLSKSILKYITKDFSMRPADKRQIQNVYKLQQYCCVPEFHSISLYRKCVRLREIVSTLSREFFYQDTHVGLMPAVKRYSRFLGQLHFSVQILLPELYQINKITIPFSVLVPYLLNAKFSNLAAKIESFPVLFIKFS